jgi:hypothetical protein
LQVWLIALLFQAVIVFSPMTTFDGRETSPPAERLDRKQCLVNDPLDWP